VDAVDSPGRSFGDVFAAKDKTARCNRDRTTASYPDARTS
jgi:hypothetical protein